MMQGTAIFHQFVAFSPAGSRHQPVRSRLRPGRVSCLSTARTISNAKRDLRDAIASTNRGGTASTSQRGAVLNAQVDLEALSKGIEYSLLPGKWRLVYTTAPDVRPLLSADNAFIPLRVPEIYQNFSSAEQGDVRNIIVFSAPPFIHKGTVEVRARWSIRSPRRIRLEFAEAGVRDIRITPLLETLLAPAVLPRTWLNHQVLLALREAQLFIPLRSRFPSPFQGAAANLERDFGSEYLFTYLDDDTLIGSQTGTGGTFIFERCSVEQPQQVFEKE